jgi:hypothetical protein
LLLWKTLDPVRSEHGLTILPMATSSSSPPLDLILVPGGAGINPLLEDVEVLDFLRRAAAMSSASAPDRWRSVPPACCAGAAPRPWMSLAGHLTDSATIR